MDVLFRPKLIVAEYIFGDVNMVEGPKNFGRHRRLSGDECLAPAKAGQLNRHIVT